MSLHIEPQENIIRENSHEDFCRVALLRFDASAEKSFHVHMTNKLFMLLKLKLAVIQVQSTIQQMKTKWPVPAALDTQARQYCLL